MISILLGLNFILYGKFMYKHRGLSPFEYYFFIFFAFFALSLLVAANDFLVLYLLLELQSLSIYILAASERTSAYSTEAGLKYFTISALSSGIILFGISLIYACTGLINFTDFGLISTCFYYSKTISNTFFILDIALIFLTIGLFFKIGAVPFHMWLPDIYDGSPLISVIFFALIPKIVIFSVLYKILNFTYYTNFIT